MVDDDEAKEALQQAMQADANVLGNLSCFALFDHLERQAPTDGTFIGVSTMYRHLPLRALTKTVPLAVAKRMHFALEQYSAAKARGVNVTAWTDRSRPTYKDDLSWAYNLLAHKLGDSEIEWTVEPVIPDVATREAIIDAGLNPIQVLPARYDVGEVGRLWPPRSVLYGNPAILGASDTSIQ